MNLTRAWELLLSIKLTKERSHLHCYTEWCYWSNNVSKYAFERLRYFQFVSEREFQLFWLGNKFRILHFCLLVLKVPSFWGPYSWYGWNVYAIVLIDLVPHLSLKRSNHVEGKFSERNVFLFSQLDLYLFILEQEDFFLFHEQFFNHCQRYWIPKQDLFDILTQTMPSLNLEALDLLECPLLGSQLLLFLRLSCYHHRGW